MFCCQSKPFQGKIRHKTYDRNYAKTHYKQIKIDLKVEEKEELEKLLKENNLTKVDFIKKAKEKLERERLIMQKYEYTIDERRV